MTDKDKTRREHTDREEDRLTNADRKTSSDHESTGSGTAGTGTAGGSRMPMDSGLSSKTGVTGTDQDGQLSE